MQRAMPSAGVFVKFDAMMLGILQFRGVVHVIYAYQISLFGRAIQLRAEGALHFKANVGTRNTSITQLEAHLYTNPQEDTQVSQ